MEALSGSVFILVVATIALVLLGAACAYLLLD